jgi:uncharacterized protein YceK
MRHLVLATVMITVLSGCGTIRGTAGGFLEGASQDLKSLSTTIKDK